MKRNNINIILAIFLVLIAATSRIINQKLGVFNLVPITAIGLFSGAMLKDKRSLAFLVPLLGQFLGDLYFQLFTNVQGFYDLTGQLFNYVALMGATGLGLMMKQPKPLTTLAYIFGASTTFFLVSNFGYFASGWNGYSFAGLVKTYRDAVPFFKNTIAGDMVGGVLLFGSYFVAQFAAIKNLQKVKA